MVNRIAFPFVALAAVLVVSAPPAQRKDNVKAKASFAVVQIGDEKKIVTATELAGLTKRLNREFRAALKRWVDARKTAQKNKQAFDDPRPKAQRAKVLAKNLATEEDARKALDTLQARAVKAAGGYAVVSVGGETRVVMTTEIAAVKKKANDDYRRAVESYIARKKAAAKRNDKFAETSPKRAKVKVIKKGFVTEADAKAFGATGSD